MNKRTTNEGNSRDSLDLLLSSRSPPRRSPLEGGGISPLDVLELPLDLQTAINHIIRMGQATAIEVAEATQTDIDETLRLLDTLVARGHLRQKGKGPESVYKPILGQSRRPRLSSRLWKILEEEE